MTVFTLIHGAWHGAWCWELLEEQLEARGHTSVAVDLPVEEATAGAEAYADAVVGRLNAIDRDGDVVVVGHSLGGTAVRFVARRVGAARMVFLSAIMPEVGLSLADIAREHPDSHAPSWSVLGARAIADPNGASHWRPSDAIEAFYHDCPPNQAVRWAGMLRKQYWRAFEEVTPVAEWPDIPSSVVVAGLDRVLAPDWHAANALRRNGEPAIRIETGHSPMCARPSEVADILVGLPLG